MSDRPKFKEGEPALAGVRAVLGRVERDASGRGSDGHGDKAVAHYQRLADEASAGITPAMLEKLRERHGAPAVYEALHAVGRDLDVPQDGRASALVVSALEARLEQAELLRDKDFSRRWLDGDAQAQARMVELSVASNPGALDPMQREEE